MKVSSYALGRPSYYDRTPVATAGSFSNILGPHALTSRWSITASATQKIFFDSGIVVATRYTAATVLGAAGATIDTPFGNTITVAYLLSNTVGTQYQSSLAGSLLVLPGATVYGMSFDGSTGGTVNYYNYVHGIAFDA